MQDREWAMHDGVIASSLHKRLLITIKTDEDDERGLPPELKVLLQSELDYLLYDQFPIPVPFKRNDK